MGGELAQQIEDEAVLQRLGYKQVLTRSWGTFTAVAITISSMSILTSITASFGTGLAYGGPVVCIWGWIGVSLLTLCIGLGMAELCSAYPTSGGMYYWMAKLAGPKYGPYACWVTGWLNLLGQCAAVSAVAYQLADLISSLVSLATGLDGGEPFVFTQNQILGVYGGLLFTSALLNSCGLNVLTLVTHLGALSNIGGVILLTIIVPVVATTHQSASYVFTTFDTASGNASGIDSSAYIFLLGLLLPAYSYTGVDGPAHMSEEVAGADLGPSKAILSGIGIMFVGGLSMVISLLFSMTSLDAVLDENNPSGGQPVPQILYDAFDSRYGTPKAGVYLMIIPILGVYFCLVATSTYVSRILFCYARDRAVPLSRLWTKVEPRTHTPLAAVWGVSIFAFMLGLPQLGSTTAFSAILSLSTISLIVVYTVPITFRVTYGAKYFVPGRFNLGKMAYPIGWLATIWAIVAAVIFCLPTEYPVTTNNLNYACVAFGGTFILSNLHFWFPKYGAYKWFHGPVRTVDESSNDGMDEPIKAGPIMG